MRLHARNIPSSIMRAALAALVAMPAAGCARQELYASLSEKQANEMVALLQGAGLDARKEAREAGRHAVTTSAEGFIASVDVLHAAGLPQSGFDSLGQVFKKEGFVSTPTEERARLNYALSQELANTLQSIDGVGVARVHLSIPERDALADRSPPSSAAVFIKHRAGQDLSAQIGQIKALVVNGVEGLNYDHVTVALFPTDAPSVTREPASRQRGPAWRVALAGGMGALLFIVMAGLVWRRWRPGRSRTGRWMRTRQLE